jgi:hypothetical protein
LVSLGISTYDLEHEEEIINESPTICSIEFENQNEFLHAVLGHKMKGRAVTEPFLTNKRLVLWLCIVPNDGEPKMFWHAMPIENIVFMRPDKKGLEIEFGSAKIGGVSASLGKKLSHKGGMASWFGDRMALEKTKIWISVTDQMGWNVNITKILKELGKI